ncbi:Hypothetical_protein [Hexamita inflata]|uniref:Hypothetical_protein n=1 Tax=Hexamita inflata TaxID=28002 RepID=A0AA86TIV9_9EUKA|nr:Hypothetical protein HINF_LOCUS7619 [Hexamita inflata]CAI9919976.1 Hypothetical protein HINF_LOCUS7621 [Hexamita inflata]CAI9919977.1 Hypothetical protein HINF_LOCUS7622 [Hexamita inflata]
MNVMNRDLLGQIVRPSARRTSYLQYSYHWRELNNNILSQSKLLRRLLILLTNYTQLHKRCTVMDFDESSSVSFVTTRRVCPTSFTKQRRTTQPVRIHRRYFGSLVVAFQELSTVVNAKLWLKLLTTIQYKDSHLMILIFQNLASLNAKYYNIQKLQVRSRKVHITKSSWQLNSQFYSTQLYFKVQFIK